MSHIPTEIVEDKFIANPVTEVLLENGDALENGMTVLVADPYERFGDPREGSAAAHYSALYRKRWCVVTLLERNGSNVSFMGKYCDGLRVLRSTRRSVPWFVKTDAVLDVLHDAAKETLTPLEDAMSHDAETKASVREIIRKLLLKQNTADYYEEKLPDEVVDKAIVDILEATEK